MNDQNNDTAASTANTELIELVINLNIYQSELEAQNDELKEAQAAIA